MALIVATVLFPHGKSSKVAKKNIEMIQKYPPDPSIGKNLAIGIMATIEGMKVLAVGQANKGKVEEFISNLAKQYQEYTNIEGFKYQIDTYLEVAEAYKVLEMEPPPEE